MTFLLIVLTTFYISILFTLFSGLGRLKSGTNTVEFNVSVIVAARNEEKHIERCIQALIAQSYPKDKFEIIIVDDRSTDATVRIVEKFIDIYSHITLLRIRQTPEGFAPKKYAIDQGIRQAKGKLLLFTDADCIPGPYWLKSMVSYFTPDVGLVAGFSPLDRTEKPSIFTKLLCLDSLSLAAVAAGSFGAGFPLTCSARNLAYRKSVYEQVDGFQEIKHFISGDDDLFLLLVKQKTAWSVCYATDHESKVSSIAPANLKQFINQRVRHASKGRHYSWKLKLGLSAVYILNFLLLIIFLSSFLNPGYIQLFAGTFILKSFFEFMLIKKAAILLDCTDYLTYFPLAAILHIPYVTIFGLWGQIGHFKWKDNLFNASSGIENQ